MCCFGRSGELRFTGDFVWGRPRRCAFACFVSFFRLLAVFQPYCINSLISCAACKTEGLYSCFGSPSAKYLVPSVVAASPLLYLVFVSCNSFGVKPNHHSVHVGVNTRGVGGAKAFKKIT